MSVRDITIMGESSVSGGQYQVIKVLGNGKFLGDLAANKLSILGNGKLKGVTADEIKITGNAHFDGPVQGKLITISGNADFLDQLTAEKIRILGIVKSRKDVEAEHFYSRGSFDIPALNANDVQICLEAGCRVQEIGAESVEVTTNGWLGAINFIGRHRRELKVTSIEADNITLENTIAESVRGNNVKIGPGCKIHLVEYKNSISIDRNASVEKSIQI